MENESYYNRITRKISTTYEAVFGSPEESKKQEIEEDLHEDWILVGRWTNLNSNKG